MSYFIKNDFKCVQEPIVYTHSNNKLINMFIFPIFIIQKSCRFFEDLFRTDELLYLFIIWEFWYFTELLKCIEQYIIRDTRCVNDTHFFSFIE